MSKLWLIFLAEPSKAPNQRSSTTSTPETRPKATTEPKPAPAVQNPSLSQPPSASKTAPQMRPAGQAPPSFAPVQATFTPPVRPPPTSPNPAPMPGSGNRVGGEEDRVVRQTTPDPEEVRRRRLAFLEKMQKWSLLLLVPLNKICST